MCLDAWADQSDKGLREECLGINIGVMLWQDLNDQLKHVLIDFVPMLTQNRGTFWIGWCQVEREYRKSKQAR